ncbi:solute carrier organic anion transporter family member 2A1-like [Asterias amurensis]|uniref:solute carrier organic anion transporter family member 2A1-like n=1 Tax=Asterias amurensis TaxID=7602 RepID=UPI003AB326EA
MDVAHSNEDRGIKDVGSPSVVVYTIEKDVDTKCGYFWWRPSCLQRFARPGVFLLVMCLFVACDGLNVGIITGSITSIEARFQFTLTELGSMQTGYCIGGIVGLLFAMYAGSRSGSNHPRLMGICGMISGVAMAVQSLPQFIQGPYTPPSHAGLENQTDGTLSSAVLTCSGHSQDCGDGVSHGISSTSAAYYIFVLGSALQGMCVMLVYPIGIAYISDCTTPGTTSLYIGIVNAVLGLGPVAGVMLAAAVIGVWVDFYGMEHGSVLALSPEDSEWIGAWWLGYLVVGIVFFIFSTLFLFFPRQMPSSSHGEYDIVSGKEVNIKVSSEEGYLTAKEFFRALLNTLKNPYCSVTCLSQSSFYFILFGYGVFIPKYLEVEFGYGRQDADLLTGVLLAPAYAVGELLAGFLVKKLNLKLRAIIRLTCGVLTGCVFGLFLLMFVGCDNDNVAGVFSSYDGLSKQSPVDLQAPCNVNCSCSLSVYAPVCNEVGVTYFSACHAGCAQSSVNKSFTDCACETASFNDSDELQMSSSVVEGACFSPCGNGVIFLIVLICVFVLATFSDLLRLTIIVRSTSSANRLVALCLAYLTQIIGIVPSGLIFGSLIDSSCVVWQESCDGVGACLLYDRDYYRLSYNGLALGVATFSALVMFVVMLWPGRKWIALAEEEHEGPGREWPGELEEQVDSKGEEETAS